MTNSTTPLDELRDAITPDPNLITLIILVSIAIGISLVIWAKIRELLNI